MRSVADMASHLGVGLAAMRVDRFRDGEIRDGRQAAGRPCYDR